MKKEDTLRILMAYGEQDAELITLIQDAIFEVGESVGTEFIVKESFAGSRILSNIEIVRPKIIILLNNREFVQGCFVAYQPVFPEINFCIIDGRGSPEEDFFGAKLFFDAFPEKIERLKSLVNDESRKLMKP